MMDQILSELIDAARPLIGEKTLAVLESIGYRLTEAEADIVRMAVESECINAKRQLIDDILAHRETP